VTDPSRNQLQPRLGGIAGHVPAKQPVNFGGIRTAGGQTLNWIDLTLSSCNYPDLNRRYHGSLILARPDSSGNLQVQSLGTPFSKDTGKVFDVKGTLRR
jgi:hypothetical protein